MSAAINANAIAQESTQTLDLTNEVKKMTLDQKVGQLFMVGFMGHDIDNGLNDLIKTIHPGSIIVFGRNIKTARQIATLNRNAQKASLRHSKLPLLIAVDQEGGDVMRIKTSTPLPSALAIGETTDGTLALKAGEATGVLLKTLGFNMNLAPVLDIADPSKKTFIGTRTYGSDADLVGTMGRHFSTGLRKSGVLSTAKHFPGHGGLGADSHKETPSKLASLNQLKQHDLVPFNTLIKELKFPWAIMLAHISYPALDPSGTPATFSKPIVEGYLRQKMSFDGLVLTDDIEMAGAFAVKDVNERAVRAIEAGSDVVMIAWNRKIQLKAKDAVIEAVRNGRIQETRLDNSVRRILKFKQEYVAKEFDVPNKKQLHFALKNPEFKNIAESTLMAKFKRPARVDELEFRKFAVEKPVYVFSASRGFYHRFREGLNGRISRFYHLAKHNGFAIDRVMRANPTAIGVFYLSGNQAASIANGISEDVARRILIVSVETEGILRNHSNFRHIADVYYRHPKLGFLVAKHYFQQPPQIETAISPRLPSNQSEDEMLEQEVVIQPKEALPSQTGPESNSEVQVEPKSP